MQSFILLVIFCIVIPSLYGSSIEGKKSFKNYHVLEVHINEEEHLSLLHSLSDTYDFWSLPVSASSTRATVMLEPQQLSPFLELLDRHQIPYSTITPDLGAVFDLEQTNQWLADNRPPSDPQFPLEHYARHSEINEYMDHLAALHPRSVRVETAGQSYEQRDIKYVRITNGRSDELNKTRIFIDAGIHAREWIAPATALYVIHQLVERAEENVDLLDNIEWIVMPCVNPDGYEHSHRIDRLWRKTRQPNSRADCPGTDGNRNYAFEWGGIGASANECSETFRGSAPFSEPETRAVRDVMVKFRESCRFYLTMHTFGNMLLYPWGYTAQLPDTWKDIDEVARAGADAIRAATGTRYVVGSSTNVLYQAAGGSDDYALGAQQIPISITMEIGGGWFVVPASEIAESVAESWVGVKAMALKVKEKYGE